MSRYLLCRPVGGFNDILCEIERCRQYAAKFKRTMIVDTIGSGLLDHFDNYFEPRSSQDDVRFRASTEDLHQLAHLTVLPAELSGRLLSYEQRWEANYCVDPTTGVRLTFDFTVDHDAELLVHRQSSGGLLSVESLSRLRFTPDIATEIRERIPCFPDGYVAIHVRNTDIKTKYRRLYRRLKAVVAGRNLLVCSDDAAAIAFARRYFAKANVFTVSDIPDTKGERLHRNPGLDRRKTNVDMLVDLIAMAGADEVHFERYALWNRYRRFLGEKPASGFSRLAERLSERPDIVDNLLYHAPSLGN